MSSATLLEFAKYPRVGDCGSVSLSEMQFNGPDAKLTAPILQETFTPTSFGEEHPVRNVVNIELTSRMKTEVRIA